MKPVYAACLLLLASGPSTEPEELLLSYRAGDVVSFEGGISISSQPSEPTVYIDGEEQPKEGADIPAEQRDDLIRTTTWIERVSDGRPVHARRRFDALTRTTVVDEEESIEEGVIAGRTLLLKGSPGEDDVEVLQAEDDEEPSIDALYLRGHRLLNNCERCLPADAVAVGDTWELEDEVVRDILGFSPEGLIFFASEAAENEGMDDVLGEMPVSGEVLYERREEADGEVCAVLLISLSAKVEEADVERSALNWEEAEGSETAAHVSLEASYEDRVWFALEQGRPVRSEVQLAASYRLSVKTTSADGELVRDLPMTMSGSCAGTWSYADR